MRTAALSELEYCLARVLQQVRSGIIDEGDLAFVYKLERHIKAAHRPPVDCWAAEELAANG